MQNEAALLFEAAKEFEKTGNQEQFTKDFRHVVIRIDAAGPENAPENMDGIVDALCDLGMREEQLLGLAEDLGREVSEEIQRALAAAWKPERLQ
jgi:hypothetical protein